MVHPGLILSINDHSSKKFSLHDYPMDLNMPSVGHQAPSDAFPRDWYMYYPMNTYSRIIKLVTAKEFSITTKVFSEKLIKEFL